jgi:hypothetical protein
MSIISYTCSSNLAGLLPNRQEFVFFRRCGRKGFRCTGWGIFHLRWSSIFEKKLIAMRNFNLVVASQKNLFLASKKWKWFFRAMKRKTSFCNIVSNPKMHMCAQYGHIITNYASILAITLLIWPKSHDTSNMIAHFVKVFL